MIMKHHRWPINTVVIVPDHSKTQGIIADQLEGGLYGINLYNGPYIVTSEECFTVLHVPDTGDEDKNYIPMEMLLDGGTYKIQARNASFGIWVYDEGGFLIRRQKMSDIYLFMEYHRDMPSFATAAPTLFIEMSPFKEQYLKSEDLEGTDRNQSFGYFHNNIILEYLKRIEEKYGATRA